MLRTHLPVDQPGGGRADDRLLQPVEPVGREAGLPPNLAQRRGGPCGGGGRVQPRAPSEGTRGTEEEQGKQVKHNVFHIRQGGGQAAGGPGGSTTTTAAAGPGNARQQAARLTESCSSWSPQTWAPGTARARQGARTRRRGCATGSPRTPWWRHTLQQGRGGCIASGG